MRLFLILFPLLLGVSFSEQNFVWFDTETKTTSRTITPLAANERSTIYVVHFKVEDEVRSEAVKCLANLVTSGHAITTASCVTVEEPYQVGLKFSVIHEDSNDPGTSMTLYSDITVRKHDDYSGDVEMNNIAVITFKLPVIELNPPLFKYFKPIYYEALPKLASYCNVTSKDVHLSSPPLERVLVIGPETCHGEAGKQAYCSVLDNDKDTVCSAMEGAPVSCSEGKLSGIVLKSTNGCLSENEHYQLRYLSVGDFTYFVEYYLGEPTTTTTTEATTTTDVSSSLKLSFLALAAVILHFTLLN